MSANPQIKAKTKKCKYCKDAFIPFNSFQKFCFKEECIKKHASLETDKKTRLEKKKRKKDFIDNNKSELEKILIKRAETVVHRYIHLRDKGNNCISCNRPMTGFIVAHAGHYRPKGSNPEVRFYTRNIYLQCEECNVKRSANLILYRQSLVKKYGNEFVERLEQMHETKKYTVEYLQRLIQVFRKKIKLYEKRR